MWPALFTLTNVVALVGWAILLLAPRKPVPLSFVMFGAVATLCLAYAAMLVALASGLADPARTPGAPHPAMLDYSVPGLMALFRSEGAIVLGWTHYLAFDLFTGLWIARDGDAKGFSRLAQAPFLLATFLVGPVGLLGWLLLRERRARANGWQRNRKTPAG